MQKTQLLSTLDWFLKWKILHNENVMKGDATNFIFFANETWFCTRALMLAHVAEIQLFCINMKVSINPGVMNTNKIEHFLETLVSSSVVVLTKRVQEEWDMR